MKYSLAAGGGRGEGAGAERGVLLEAAEKGVAVLRFPGAAGKGEEGAAKQRGERVTGKANAGYGVVH